MTKDELDLGRFTREKTSKTLSGCIETRKTTGTSIIALPYKEGYLIASDCRATNPSTYEYYTTDKITPYGQHFTVAGAGLAIGLNTAMTPFITYFYSYLKYYCYEINEIPDVYCLLSLWNNAAIKYLKEEADSLYFETIGHSIFTVVFRNKHILVAYNSRLVGDDSLENFNSYAFNTKLASEHYFAGDFTAIGSGSRYLVGSILAENKTRLLKEQSRTEILRFLPSVFQSTTTRDLASSVESYLEVVTVPRDFTVSVIKQRVIL